ncbi:MAG: hypothetical protein F6K11_19810 [Leptolyngbya sp. SIO3F4]|nr:hypothetical protein [Leptolyngbya sp. SIO3F4]
MMFLTFGLLTRIVPDGMMSYRGCCNTLTIQYRLCVLPHGIAGHCWHCVGLF